MRKSELDAKTLAWIAEHGKEGPRLALPGVEMEPEAKTPPSFLEASVSLEGAVLVCVFPILTKSEANEPRWKHKARRAKDARAIVSRTLGPHLALLAPFAAAYHKGEALRVKFVRCGGRKLDVMANLGAALKATEDGVATMCGASDADPRWHAEASQLCSGPVGVVVRIEVFR